MRAISNYLLAISLIILVNNDLLNWWIYEPNDSDVIHNDKEILDIFIEDQNKCTYTSNQNCNSANSRLMSAPPFDNQCCKIDTSTYHNCLTVFKGKYFNSNLYSLDRKNTDFSYDCDGNGSKTFDSSKYNPTEKWEVIVKEKLDCIYSENEEKCQSNPKSFKYNTRCCWFSNDNYRSEASCFGLSDLNDEEFNRAIPYLTLATLSRSNGEMDFRCFSKSGKVIKGKYNLDFNISEMGSTQEKLLEEMLSDNPLDIFSKKQKFISIKNYDRTLTNSFNIYTISPNQDPKPYVVSVKFSYTITGIRIRNLETKTEDKIASCKIEDIDKNSELNITTSTCTFPNDEGYIAEKIEIQPGHDLIGKFNDNNKFASPGMNLSNDEINKLNDTAYFSFDNSITNLNSKTFEGETTEDRKNVEFVIYHLKDENTIQNVIGKATFLKESKIVNFTTEPEINFNEGITIIPNQLVKSEDGKYLYFKNQIKNGEINISPNEVSPQTTNVVEPNGNSSDNFINFQRKKQSTGISTGGIIAIIIPCCIILVVAGIISIMCKSSSSKLKDNENSNSNVYINNNN